MIALDAQPNSERGTVILLGSQCRYVIGPDMWKTVRQYGIDVYTRHGIRCPSYVLRGD